MSFLDRFISDIKATREAWLNRTWSDAPEHPDDPGRGRWAIQWGRPTAGNLAVANQPYMTLAEGREYITRELENYVATPERTDAVLVKTQPGTGKSYAAIVLAQRYASEGKRVLYLMPRNNYWQDIIKSPVFDSSLWYHWQATNGTDPLSGEPMCKFHSQAAIWMSKGYSLISQCKGLCKSDGYMSQCPYRQQARRKEKIIAGVHNHLITGLAISDFEIVIVDELFLSAFIQDRVVPDRFLDVGGHHSVKNLTGALTALSRGILDNRRIRANALFDYKYDGEKTGDTLTKIYENINLGGSWLPAIPPIEQPDDVYKAPYWYIYDLLSLLTPEHIAWQRGMSDWLSRVYVDRNGLHLLKRAAPWKDLPSKIIILDGTGLKEIYERLLDRSVTVIDAPIKRKGKIFQITERLNGVGQVLGDKTSEPFRQLSENGQSLLELCDIVSRSKKTGDGFGTYQKIGIVTFKAAVPYFEALFGPGNVLYFGGNRGSNSFVDEKRPYDCIIVAGCPSPPDGDMIDVVAQIMFDPKSPADSRIDPFKMVHTAQGWQPVRSHSLQEYHYINGDGQAAFRMHGGFWAYQDLQMVYSLFREMEVVQAIERGRTLLNDCDVWVLSSLPLPIQLDGIFDSPNDCLNLPGMVHWERWAKLSRWLNSQSDFIPVKTIAEREQVTPEWAARWCKSIEQWQPKNWRYTNDPAPQGRGQPKKGLLKL